MMLADQKPKEQITMNNRSSRTPRCNKKNTKVETTPRNVKSSLNNMNRVSVCNAITKNVVLNVNSEYVCSTCNDCLFSANHDMCVVDYLNNVNSRTRAKSAPGTISQENTYFSLPNMMAYLTPTIRHRFIMDDPNITMKEYIRLQEEKALSRAIVFDDTSNVALLCEHAIDAPEADKGAYAVQHPYSTSATTTASSAPVVCIKIERLAEDVLQVMLEGCCGLVRSLVERPFTEHTRVLHLEDPL
ncbi:hypothetical protein Tco_0677515 [Tanacetum coccineum]|uniref:Uncharacterized protein n=1 Tax=Tanacetum coccineum TaxID=301880 RepID=A0ABQ4XCG3_9ASTR